MRSVDSLGDGRGDREHSFSSPLTKTAAPAQADKDGCIQLLDSYIELQPLQVSDLAFPEECSRRVSGAEDIGRPSEAPACVCKSGRHASVRGDHGGGCCLDTEDGELSRIPAAVPAVTAPCDSHGHHAYAYRQTHHDRELDFVPLLEQHESCIMDDWSARSRPETPLDFEEPRYSYYSGEDGEILSEESAVDEVLRAFILDKKSLVLDSLFPEIAPHIVITAPHDPWEGSLAHDWNSPLPQDESSLTIPLQYIAPEYAPSYGLIEYYGQLSGYDFRSFVERPAFRPSRFTISSAEEDDELSSSLLRLYKMAARTAMTIAPKFCERWDTASFAASQEKPFTWSDPGAPLLEFYGSCRDTRIIDSHHPFTAPHIIIHEAPDPTPWEACANRVVVPQHCWYLMVPGTPCHCPPQVNTSAPASPLPSEGPSHVEAADEWQEGSLTCLHEGFEDASEELDADGESDEMATLSPSDESDSNSEFWPDTPKEDVFRFNVPDNPPPSNLPSEPFLPHSSYKASHPFDAPSDHGSALEEDEDDLPPFDEWYQNIAQRTAG